MAAYWLAWELKQPDPEAMLERLDARQFAEWLEFLELTAEARAWRTI